MNAGKQLQSAGLQTRAAVFWVSNTKEIFVRVRPPSVDGASDHIDDAGVFHWMQYGSCAQAAASSSKTREHPTGRLTIKRSILMITDMVFLPASKFKVQGYGHGVLETL